MPRAETRRPVVAGQFYPGRASQLKKQIEDFIVEQQEKSACLACIVPHAGYVYSGRVAVETLARAEIKEKIVLIGPNHTGYGKRFSVMGQGSWLTPLGETEIDRGLSQALIRDSRLFEDDNTAHAFEHSLEVELPILQYFGDAFKIVPITVGTQDSGLLDAAGEELAEKIKSHGFSGKTMIVASTDMTHYEPQESAEKKDKQAIEAMLGLDEKKLEQKVKGLKISMCGYSAVVIALKAAKALGASRAELVRYTTSAEASKDRSSVVGYCGMVIK